MKTLKLLVLVSVLAGCSVEPLKDQSQAQATPASAVQAQAAPQAETVYHPLTVADAYNLPPCNEVAEGWIVYLKTEAQFEVCAGGGWLTVDIKGKDGVNGKDGVAGVSVAGAKGDKGDTGTPGIGVPQLGDTWFDPDTGKGWRIMSASATYANAACPNNYALPDNSTFPGRTFYHYFLTFFMMQPTTTRFWTSIPNGGGHTTGHFTAAYDGSYDIAQSADTSTNLVICHEQ